MDNYKWKGKHERVSVVSWVHGKVAVTEENGAVKIWL